MSTHSTVRSPRCLWCNGSDGDELVELTIESEVVRAHRAHREEVLRFVKDTAASKWIFLGGIGGSLLLGLVAMFVVIAGSPRIGAGVSAVAVAVCGAVLLRYPFATPETITLLGIRRSAQLVRLSGVVILALAVYLIVVAAAP